MINEEVTGIILAGGKSSRLGQNKGLAHFRSRPLVSYAIKTLEPICSEIIISANNDLEEYQKFGLEIITDELQNIGPMGGLVACLKKSTTRFNFVMACDTPFVNSDLFVYLLNNIENFQMAIPEHGDGMLEPLIGCYTTNILWYLEEAVKAGDYSLRGLMKKIRIKKVIIDPELPFFHENLFFNVNTPKELESL